MATFTDPRAFANHVAGYGTKIEAAGPRALKAAALAATNDIRAEGSRYHITRGKKKKTPLTAGYKMVGADASVTPNNPGAWKIIEDGTRAHFEGGGSRRRKGFSGPILPGGGGTRGSKGVVLAPGVGRGVFAYVRHPATGSTGHPWAKGVARAKVSAPAAFQREIVKVFG